MTQEWKVRGRKVGDGWMEGGLGKSVLVCVVYGQREREREREYCKFFHIQSVKRIGSSGCIL